MERGALQCSPVEWQMARPGLLDPPKLCAGIGPLIWILVPVVFRPCCPNRSILQGVYLFPIVGLPLLLLPPAPPTLLAAPIKPSSTVQTDPAWRP